MNLATHNTMSYLTPKQWWARLIPWVAKCQSKNYIEQYNAGARAFDLRILWDENNELEFRHGLYRYSGKDFYNVLEFADKHSMIVRILLDLRDYSGCKNPQEQRDMFIKLCKEIEEKYENIQFYNDSNTYHFKEKEKFTAIHKYSSMTSLFKNDNEYLAKADDLCPWIYAKICNKKNIQKYKDLDDSHYLFIDFI